MPGMLNELKDTVPHQRLAAREEKDRYAEVAKILNQPAAFVVGEFAAVILIVRVRITVHAAKVASPPDIPYNDGFLV